MQSCLHHLSWGRTLQRKELSSTSSCGTCDPLKEGHAFLSGPYWLWASQRENGVNKTPFTGSKLEWALYFQLKPMPQGKALICLVD